MAPYRTSPIFLNRAWQKMLDIMAGGSWSRQLSEAIQHNLRAFFWDGVLSASSDAITVNYFTLFLLALGATSTQIGLLSSLSNMAAVLVLLPGAMLVDRLGKRKPLILWTGGGFSRLMLPVYALIPLLVPHPVAIYLAIGLKVLADGSANLALPAWVSMSADIIPLAWRGRYFGTRNLVMGICGMVITFLGGEFITRSGAISGYQWAFIAAFAIGMISTFAFSQIREPKRPAVVLPVQTYTPIALLQTLQSDKAFLVFCLFNLFWNFSISIAGPFFSVYQVQVLKASATMVGILSIVSSLSSLPALRFFGPLADRIGSRRVMVITGLLIPIVPIAWVWTTQPWHGIPINILSGFLWAGFSLAQFNMLLIISPDEHRARYSAIFQIMVAISAAVGAALGGVISHQWGYHTVFLLSGIGRFLSMLIFIRFVSWADLEKH